MLTSKYFDITFKICKMILKNEKMRIVDIQYEQMDICDKTSYNNHQSRLSKQQL